MSHLDLPRAATHAYVGSIEELGRRLEPSVGADYCEACDVPTLAPPQSFFAKVSEAGALLRQDEYLAATAKASEAVEILRELLSAEAETEERVELLVQRLAVPALLDLLRRGQEWARADDPMSFTGKAFGGAYLVLVVLMMLDRRLAEWFPDAFAGHRMAALLGKTVETWKRASDGGDADTAWPFYVVDTLGPLVAVLNAVVGLETQRLQLWQGYGFDPADGTPDTPARRTAQRTLSLWWERHPDYAVKDANYAPTHPTSPDFSLGITLVPVDAAAGGPTLAPFVNGDTTQVLPLGARWALKVVGGTGAGPSVSDASTGSGDLGVTLSYGGTEPALSWGDADEPGKGRSLTLQTVEIEARVVGDVEGTDPGRGDAGALLRIKKGAFSIGAPNNVFLKRLLPQGVKGEFAAGFGASVRGGFHWEGGLGTEVFTTVDWRSPKVLGVGVDVTHLRLALAFTASEATGATLMFTAGIGVRVHLGPLRLGVGDLGGALALAHRPETDGNLGPFDVGWTYVEPRSVDFVLIGELYRGEGFLAFDRTRDLWQGAWRIKIRRFQLDGVVIAEGDSLLAVAWLRNLGWALPAGTIDGAGVLVGYGRRADAGAFLAGLTSGVVGTVLFPDDPVGEAPQLLAVLGQLFPRQDGSLVLGLMIQWTFGGRARLITAELGVIVEFAGGALKHVYVLGQGQMGLKHLPRDVYRVQVDLFGHYDVEAGTFFLRAELRDSRLAGGELTGGGLISYDESAEERFVASLGGFNPRYSAPARLQGVPRITAHLADRPQLKIYFELYLAVTSSSIQLGGKLALRLEAKGLIIEGYLALDLLARFDGEFFLDVAFFVAVRRGDRTLASLEVAGTLAGMSTWSLTGRATLKVLFVKVSIPIEWKRAGAPPAPEVTDGQAALVAALTSAESWSQPAATTSVDLADAVRDGVWLVPDRGLQVSQTLLPLGEVVTRLGPSPLPGEQQFTVTGLTFGSTTVTGTPVTDRFNLALYRDVDLEEAIRAPFVESLTSGTTVDLAGIEAGDGVPAAAGHEDIVLDDRFVPAARGLAATAFAHRPPRPSLDDFYPTTATPFTVGPPRFVVLDTGLRTQLGGAGGVPYALARDRVRADRRLSRRRYVARRYEATSGAPS